MAERSGPLSVESAIPWTFLIEIVGLQRVQDEDLVCYPFIEFCIPNCCDLACRMQVGIDCIATIDVVDNTISGQHDTTCVVGVVNRSDDITVAREILGKKRILGAPSSPCVVEEKDRKRAAVSRHGSVLSGVCPEDAAIGRSWNCF